MPTKTRKPRTEWIRYGTWQEAIYQRNRRGMLQGFRHTSETRRDFAESLVASEPDACVETLFDLANRAFNAGEPDAARHYLKLHDELVEYIENPRDNINEPLPWEEVNPMEPKSRPKPKRIDVLTRDDIDALVAEAYYDYSGPRNVALIELLWATGMRIGEAIDLKPDDLQIHGAWATVKVPETGKTGARDVSVRLVERGNPTQLKVALDNYLPIRVGDHLFTTAKGKQLTRNQVNMSLKTYAKKAGINKRIHSHVFRHSFATLHAAHGTNPFDIQALLGHKTMSMTSRYVQAGTALRFGTRWEEEERQWSERH